MLLPEDFSAISRSRPCGMPKLRRLTEDRMRQASRLPFHQPCGRIDLKREDFEPYSSREQRAAYELSIDGEDVQKDGAGQPVRNPKSSPTAPRTRGQHPGPRCKRDAAHERAVACLHARLLVGEISCKPLEGPDHRSNRSFHDRLDVRIRRSGHVGLHELVRASRPDVPVTSAGRERAPGIEITALASR